MNDTSQRKKAKVIKANYALQKRVGVVTIPQETLNKAEAVMASHEIDFVPLANRYLQTLSDTVQSYKEGEIKSGSLAIAAMAAPIMELKANGTTFGYVLVGRLADILLVFIESVDEIDAHIIELVELYHKMTHVLIQQKMKGDGGEYGDVMVRELQAACTRYDKKIRS